jgi:hypothetical protein
MTVLELATTKIALYKIYFFLHLFPFCRQLTPFTPHPRPPSPLGTQFPNFPTAFFPSPTDLHLPTPS